MKFAYTYAVVLAGLLLRPASPATAQEQKCDEECRSASLVGTPGLFMTWDAETLRGGEISAGLGFNYYNRDPGRQMLRQLPVAFAIGILDRLELFASYDVNKSLDASGIVPYRTWFDGWPRPAVTLQGVPHFNNESPFVDVPRSSGLGDLRFGIAVNLLSQRRENPLGLSFTGFVKRPTGKYMRAMNGGLSNGVNELGFAVLASRRFGRAVAVHLNLGANFMEQPEKNGTILATLQHSFIYRVGVALPNYGKIQFISEVRGSQYFGDRLWNGSFGLNPKSPIDAIFGFKVYPKQWISLGAGYQAHFNRVEQDLSQGILESGRHGLVAQMMFALGKQRQSKGRSAPIH